MRSERPSAITKTLSRNDTGETGGHQAGILIPRDPQILSFFPEVDANQYNPRHLISFRDSTMGQWTFAFIYYNNRRFDGTRDEYRLTRMTGFVRAHNLKAGDRLTLLREGTAGYRAEYERQRAQQDDDRVRLGTSWRIVEIHGR